MKPDVDNPAGLSTAMLDEVDRICLEFERAWQRAGQPEIKAFLAKGSEASRSALLRELLLLDVDYRSRNGLPAGEADYLTQFPQETSVIRAVCVQPSVETVDARQVQAVESTRCIPSHEPARPSHLGRYRIEAQIGSGAFGNVYRAYDDQLRRFVAIKGLHGPRLADPVAKEMFLNEARTLAALRHPAIVPIHDVGSESCYIVSDYMEGGTLSEYARTVQLSTNRVAQIVIRIAEALHYAHGKGLVHRDVKLSNILRDAEGNVYITDFGLALRDEDVGTGEGFAGTPCNMSPEQARGDAHLVDGRADVYGLGCVLYELLTGRRVFDAKDVPTLLQQIERQQPRPPRQIDDRIPVELEQVCLKALAKSPSDRYSTALDMAKHLRRCISPPVEIRRNVSRPWWQAGMAIVVVSLLWMIFGPRDSIQPPGDRSAPPAPATIHTLAVLPFRTGPDSEPYLGHGMADSLVTQLSNVRQIVVRSSESVAPYAGSQADPIALGKMLRVDVVLDANVQQISDQIRASVRLFRVADGHLLWGATFDRSSSDLLAVQDMIAAQVVRALALQLTTDEQRRVARRPTENRRAYEEYVKGRYYWNQRSNIDRTGLGKAIQHFQEAIDADPLYALAYSGLAECYALLNLYNGTMDETAMPRARAAANKALELDDQLTEAQATLAYVTFHYDWDWERSEKEFLRALELNPNYATAHQWYGETLNFMRRFDEAITQLKRAVELDPLSPVIDAVQAAPYLWQRDYPRARQEYLKIQQRHPNSSLVMFGLAQCAEQESKLEEALQLYQAELYEPGQAFILARMGKVIEARSILDKMLAKSPHPQAPYNIALVYLALGELDAAFEWLEKARLARDEHMAWLQVDPKLDSVRDDPRFHRLLEQVGWRK